LKSRGNFLQKNSGLKTGEFFFKVRFHKVTHPNFAYMPAYSECRLFADDDFWFFQAEHIAGMAQKAKVTESTPYTHKKVSIPNI
jgi:hypothetical protein